MGIDKLKVEYVLQALVENKWQDSSLPKASLKTVVDLALIIRKSKPGVEQRIVKRTTLATEKALIDKI